MLTLFKSLFKKPPHILQSLHNVKKIYEDNTEKIQIRTMAYDELEETRRSWAKEEGWPSEKHGMEAIYKLDPDGFYVLEQNGEKRASLAIIAYPNIQYAYMGFFIAPRSQRGQGYGGILLRESMKYTQLQRGISSFELNCLENKKATYSRLGFHTTTIDNVWKLTCKNPQRFRCNVNMVTSSKKELDEKKFQDLVQYDGSVFGTTRTEFLYAYLSKAYTNVIVFQEGGKIQGYAVISRSKAATATNKASYRIGPLYAANTSIASLLLDQILANSDITTNEHLFLECAGTNPTINSLVESHGFEHDYKMVKMIKGELTKRDLNQTFIYSPGQARVTA